MAGGISNYASICARVRVKYSLLLDAKGMRTLEDAPELAALVEALKHTQYADELEQLREREPTVPAIVAALRRRLASEARSVIQGTPGAARRVLIQLHRRHELDNLKAILRGVATGPAGDDAGPLWERVRGLLFPVGESTAIPAERMLETGSITGAIELLRGTPYYEALNLGLKRYSSEQSLFPLEVALDLDYWRRLWQEARKLSGEDQLQAIRVIGSLVDANNFMWAIRYRVYKHLSEEELINYTLPFGHRVRDEDIRAIAAGGDMGAILSRLYPELEGARALLDAPGSGLPRLETELKRVTARRCMAAFLGNPFHIGLPLAYLVLHDLEVEDLIVLLEAKSSKLAAEDFLPYVLQGEGVPAP